MTREEREDAIGIIQSILNKYEEDECLVTEITIGDEDIKAFKMAIKALEQEPKKGHWIIDTHKIRAFGKKYETHDYSVHCDKCNYACDYTTDKVGSGGLVSNFCPNCGAKMEKRIEEVEE